MWECKCLKQLDWSLNRLYPAGSLVQSLGYVCHLCERHVRTWLSLSGLHVRANSFCEDTYLHITFPSPFPLILTITTECLAPTLKLILTQTLKPILTLKCPLNLCRKVKAEQNVLTLPNCSHSYGLKLKLACPVYTYKQHTQWHTDKCAHAAFLMIPCVYVYVVCIYEPAACWLSLASLSLQTDAAAGCSVPQWEFPQEAAQWGAEPGWAISAAVTLSLSGMLTIICLLWLLMLMWAWWEEVFSECLAPLLKDIILLLNYRLVLLMDCGVLSQGLRGDDHTPITHQKSHIKKQWGKSCLFFSLIFKQ